MPSWNSDGCNQMPQFNPNTHTIAWQRLEDMRYRSLGLPKYSRHFNVTRRPQNRKLGATPMVLTGHSSNFNSFSSAGSAFGATIDRTPPGGGLVITNTKSLGMGGNLDNSLAPFNSVGKSTCGYYFSRTTDNRKIDFGIPPSDLVQWRSFIMQPSQ